MVREAVQRGPEKELLGRMSMRHILVVACRTAGSNRLHAALRDRARRGPAEFTLLMPAPAGADDAGLRIRAAVERLREEGLDVAGQLGAADPFVAVAEVWDPAEYDEIVLSTLPPDESHWLTADVPRRLERLTGVAVAHVVASAADG
jgi:hypothetical protein